MTSFDLLVLVVVGISILVGVLRGAVKGVISLTSWVIAFFVARWGMFRVEPWLPVDISDESLRYLVAFGVLFVVAVLVLAVVAAFLSHLVHAVGLGAVDRFLGGVVGLVRAVFVVLVATLLAGLSSLPATQEWRNSMFSAPAEAAVVMMLPLLPRDLRERVRFD